MIVGRYKSRIDLLILGLFFFGAMNIFPENIEVYREIQDMCHPTLEDLHKIQEYLFTAERPDIKKLIDREFVPREFKFIGMGPNELPQYYSASVNSQDSERENCIVIYASFNENYPEGAKRLYKRILNSNFRGHVHCRIGGWPDIEAGSLSLVHVPFAFKVCFIKEMQRKGYKRILWLDSSLLPAMDLNKVFEKIQQTGYLVQANTHTFHPPYMNLETAASLGYTFEEATSLLSCAAHIFGVDLTDKKVAKLVDDWYAAAKDPYSFYSARSDQTALSLLLHKAGMTDWVSAKCTGSLSDRNSNTIVIMDREFVKNNR